MSELHRFYTSFPNIVLDQGLKAVYIGKYLDYYFKGTDFSIKDWKVFERHGIAEKYSPNEDEIIKLLQSKIPQATSGANKTCEWCSCKSYILHKHHYPLKKSQGGQITVNICPNCHYEFHYLMDIKYRIKPEFCAEVVL